MEKTLLHLALDFLLGVEGRYSNDPDDRGGETWCGIARNKNPDWRGWQIIDSYRHVSTFPVVLDSIPELIYFRDELYRKEYWDKCFCDNMDAEMAVVMFGSAVNHGPHRAAMLLQQTLHVKMDGVIGPKTMGAMQSFIKSYGIDVMLVEFLGYRAEFYYGIVRSDSSQAKYLRGWFNRLFKLQQFVLGM